MLHVMIAVLHVGVHVLQVQDFMSGDVLLDPFVQKHLEMRLNHHVLDLKRQAAETLLASSGLPAGARGSS